MTAVSMTTMAACIVLAAVMSGVQAAEPDTAGNSVKIVPIPKSIKNGATRAKSRTPKKRPQTKRLYNYTYYIGMP